MWSNRNKIISGQSKTLAIEGLREGDAFYSLQIYDKILDWFCPIFLVVYIVLSETHLRSSISAESFVACCGCGASSKLSLAYLLLAHTTTTISRHFYKTLSNNKSLICKSALNFSVGAKIPLVSSKRALQNWLFKSKVNIRRSMLIRKGKLRKYHLQLVRRKVVLWSHSLSRSICWHYYKQMGSPHIFLLLWSNILQKESPEYPSYSLYLWSIAANLCILFT